MAKEYNLLRSMEISTSGYLQKRQNLNASKGFRKFFNVAFLFMIALFVQSSFGQNISNYGFTYTNTGTLEDISSGATTLMTGNQDDTATAVTPIGFDFYFMGTKYTHFSANSNGQVLLHTSASATAIAGTNLTGYTAGTALLAAFANDNEVNNGMTMKIVGTAPNRKLVIEWDQFYVYYTNITNGGKLQMWLSESTGKIDYAYGAIYNSYTLSVTRSIFISAGNTATTAGHVIIGATPTFTPAAAPVTNTIAAGTVTSGVASPLIANIGSSAEGSRWIYSFTPPSTTPVDPTTLTFSAISATSITPNWVDNSNEESFFIVTRATDAAFTQNVVTATVASTSSATTGTAYSLAQTGLSPGTTYYYKVQSGVEGGIPSAGITGSATTLAGTTYYWVGTSVGTWNTPANWNTAADGSGSPRTTPDTTDVMIVDGDGTTPGGATTISVDVASFSIGQFKVTNNTACTLQSSITTTRTITLLGGPNEDFLIENGSTLNLTNATMAVAFAFTGSGNTGSLLGTLNLGGSTANIFNTTGGTGTLVTVGTTGIINNTITGAVGVTGSVASLSFLDGSAFNVSGATTGAPNVPLATWATNATLTISGLTTSTTAPTNNNQSFGNIVFNSTTLTGSYPFFTATTTAVVKGNLTVMATGTGQFRTVSSGTLTINGNVNVLGGRYVPFSAAGVVRVEGNTTVATGAIFDLSIGAGMYLQRGTTFTNNGTVNGPNAATPASTLYFFPTTAVAQTWDGTGSIGTALHTISLNNTAGLTITQSGSIPLLRANLFTGTITGSDKFTFGTGAALACTIQVGAATLTTPGGVLASAPTWNLGTGTMTLLYSQCAAYTTNNEVPTTRTVTNLTVDNTNGVTLTGGNLEVSGTLTLTAGNITTSSSNILNLGTTTAAGTLNGGSTVSYVKGPFARTIASGNANTNYILLPVGKTAYAPVWVAPATTAVSIMKGEAFDSNSGTADASIISLAANRRWEAPLVSGTITNINVKVGDANLIATNIPVQAPAAAGAYSAAFGPIATFAAGTAVVPNTIQSNSVVTSANYTGFLSYAVSNACSGTPTPGATTATAATICLGGSTTLGITNIPAGTGLTYQWQSSLDGTTYTDIASATSATYTATPTAATYYQCVVTCATGPASGTSTPIQITFTNNVTGTTPATRCGTGTVDLAATTSSGTIKWYTASTGGASVATGSPFTTPSISADTTYYVAAETSGGSLYGGKLTPESTWTGSTFTDWGIVFSALQTTVLNSVDVYSTSAGTLTVKITDASGVELFATPTITVTAGGTTTPTTIPLNFNIVQGTTYKILVKSYSGVSLVRGSTNIAFPYNNGAVNVTASEWGGTTTGTYYYFYNFKTESSCSSPRVPVVATVTAPPALALSTSTATICNGETSSAVTITSGASDYDTYVWTPSTGVSGDATNGWTFNPTETTAYTLSASQNAGSLCTNTAALTVTVNPVPSAIVIAPSPANVCVNNIQALTATGGTIGSTVTATVGNATTLTGATVEPTAFSNRWKHYWVQMVYTAAELNALGFTAGNITALKFNITTLGDGTNVTDFKVRMGNTTNATLTAFTTTGLTQVYGTATYTHAIGENTITFDTPYAWDGVSNIIVDMRQTGQDITNNSQTYYTATAGNTVVWARTSTTTSSDGFPASNPAATTSVNRLNTTFVVSSSQPTTFAWTPTTDLFTDSAATTAYTGENLTTVYVKSSTPGSTVYTATSTSALGCPTSSTVTVNVNALPVAPTASATVQPTCTVTTGTIEVTAPTGATLEYSVDGSTYQASTTFAGIVPGTYSVTVKDTVTGCVSSASSVTINAIPAAPVAPTASATVQPTCTVTTGTIEVTAPTGAYEYSVDGATYQASTTFAGLTPGTYSVTVKDTATGCVSSATSVTINAIPAAPAAPTASATVQPTCTVTTGTIEITAPTGSTLQYSVDGTTYLASAVFADLAPGTYSVTVKDTATGCVSSATSVTVNAIPAAPAAPTASATVQPTCMTPTGTIEITAPTGAYEYSVDGTTYLASAVFADLAPGTYNVTVKDTATGCVSSATSVTIDAVPAAPAAPTVTVTQPTCSVATGTIQFTSPLGTAYLYSVDGLNYTDASTTFSGLVPGTYNASVYNFDTGCVSGNTTVVIDVAPAGPDAPTGSATQSFTVAALTDATIDNLVATGTNVVWYPTEADALAGTNAIAPGTQIFDGVTYYATQTVGGCTSATALAVTVTVTLGMNGFDASSFKYYPNPVSDKLNIEYSSTITDVELFNAIGQLIAKTSNDATTVGIDMSRYASGTYIVKVTMDNAVKTIKVVKN